MSKKTDSSPDVGKLSLEIFVPLGSCTCEYQQYLDRVFEVLQPFKHLIQFQVKDAAGRDADKYELFQNTVVVNGIRRFTRPTDLGDFLNQALGTPTGKNAEK